AARARSVGPGFARPRPPPRHTRVNLLIATASDRRSRPSWQARLARCTLLDMARVGADVSIITRDEGRWDDLRSTLTERGHRMLPLAQASRLDVLIADVASGDDVWEELAGARAAHPMATVVAVTAPNEPDAVVRALEVGAEHCIPRPVRVQALVLVVQRIAARGAVPLPSEPQVGFHGLVGNHPSIQQLIKRVRQVARSRSTALLTGES